jgi:hypothetical protein
MTNLILVLPTTHPQCYGGRRSSEWWGVLPRLQCGDLSGEVVTHPCLASTSTYTPTTCASRCDGSASRGQPFHAPRVYREDSAELVAFHTTTRTKESIRSPSQANKFPTMRKASPWPRPSIFSLLENKAKRDRRLSWIGEIGSPPGFSSFPV